IPCGCAFRARIVYPKEWAGTWHSQLSLPSCSKRKASIWWTAARVQMLTLQRHGYSIIKLTKLPWRRKFKLKHRFEIVFFNNRYLVLIDFLFLRFQLGQWVASSLPNGPSVYSVRTRPH